ncbi:HdeD family acid-resistance protein [Pararhizobium sp. O133]|uniref:HdeD family acid-resistance protein n=1 Tax=Pararhizobium sp. O133 TaxID=3449278 RepID=UPI003F688495
MMTSQSSVGHPRSSRWTNSAIGIALVLAGVFVLADVALATVVSAVVLAIVAICAGLVEIGLSVMAGGWRRSLWQIPLGLLYIAFGLALLSLPGFGSQFLTWALGVILLLSGIARVFVGVNYLRSGKRAMFFSGMLGVITGFLILVGYPATSGWVIGTFLGVDLIVHGIGWLNADRGV